MNILSSFTAINVDVMVKIIGFLAVFIITKVATSRLASQAKATKTSILQKKSFITTYARYIVSGLIAISLLTMMALDKTGSSFSITQILLFVFMAILALYLKFGQQEKA